MCKRVSQPRSGGALTDRTRGRFRLTVAVRQRSFPFFPQSFFLFYERQIVILNAFAPAAISICAGAKGIIGLSDGGLCRRVVAAGRETDYRRVFAVGDHVFPTAASSRASRSCAVASVLHSFPQRRLSVCLCLEFSHSALSP